MAARVVSMAPRIAEVAMVEPAVVRQIRALADRGWGSRSIAAELGLARNTVRSYWRKEARPLQQERPRGRRLDEAAREEARALFEGTAEGNAVVVRDLLVERGCRVGVRTIQRLVEGRRRELRASQVATLRFETAPGQQMQVDFGEKRIRLAGLSVKI
jgi:transposase